MALGAVVVVVGDVVVVLAVVVVVVVVVVGADDERTWNDAALSFQWCNVPQPVPNTPTLIV